jgi:hypothetical protein
MTIRETCRAFAAACAVLSSQLAAAGDTVVGTLTVNGKPSALKCVAGAVQADPEDGSRSWLVVLASDVAVAPGDRTPARLGELAAAGKVKAVRVLWLDGTDTLYATAYHQALPQSGRRGSVSPSIDLERYDGTRFEGTVRSKMMGQAWFFQAQVKTALTRGGVVEVEAPAAEEEQAAGGGGGAARADDRTAKKMALAKLGYEYTPEMFEHAVTDSSVEAVTLFLALGMPANTGGAPDRQPLAMAVTQCGYGHEAEALEMARALLAAGAKADAGARDGITPLLDAAQFCAGAEIVELLIGAGANVNTRAPGGATPLMFAKIFNKTAIEAALRKAGARE